ncbi:hypothetical protein PENSPDRAFT_286307 [Peniophora sp. CONT]|nr:hypothetical protein PENSPDRAFT_286307 [Peniophora sp. CONT]
MSNSSELPDVPPPAYHDGRGIQRLPAYRETHLRRYHPYGREEPSLLQRLLLSPWPHSQLPEEDANAGLRTRVGDGAAAPASVPLEENTGAVIATSSSSPLSSGPRVNREMSPPSCRCTASTTRSVKRKREDFENDEN